VHPRTAPPLIQIKALLWATKARLQDACAITQALAAVTADNAVAWSRHCGWGYTSYETA